MHEYVAYHILNGTISQLEKTCGFCGHNETNCSILLQSRTKNFTKPISDCSYFHKFNIKSAYKISANYPCTNIGIFVHG